VDKGVQRFFEQCADAGSPNCAVAVAGQSGKQLQNTFDAFLQNLDYTQAKQVRDAFYKVLYFQSATAFKDFATTLSKYYKDSSTIRRRALTRRQLEWKPDYAEIKTELAISGITCGDVVQRFKGSRDNFKKWLATYEKTSKYGGDIAISLLYQCSVWTVDAREKFTGAFSGIRTKNPILFLNGQYDPVTPLLSAQNSAAGFVGARVLQSSGVGVSVGTLIITYI
jgi:pimeloyl-ACP methyl ester carboxylesterase